MDVADKNILVVGMGASGVAAARFLRNRGAQVTLSDSADEAALGEYLTLIRGMDIKVELGRHDSNTFEASDLIVVSPGVPHTIPPLERAKARGIEVIGEIELAARYIREPMVAVTGTNGKTTTSTLIGDMIRQSGLNVFVGGNIGNPLTNYVDAGEKADVLVVEVSSFQLDTIVSFSPRVGILLNITQDHQDRYPDFDSYAASKARIFENQAVDDIAILNGNDPVSLSVCKNIKGRKMFIHHISASEKGVIFKPPMAIIRDGHIAIDMGVNGEARGDLVLSGTGLMGRHNLENVAAASLATLAVGGSLEGIRTALKDFSGLPHRLEYVDAFDGVEYYDDSKATNVDAVVKALDAFSSPVILILGGRNKGNDFHTLERAVRQHTKKLVIMGEAKGEIASILGHLVSTEIVDSLDEAVELAYQTATAGDVVLLSPACASFDMFSSYADRGRTFQKAVQNLRHGDEWV